MKENIIKALKSRTVLVAIAQAVVGVLVIFLTEADLLGYAAMVKSLGDVILRFDTTKPISEK